MKLTLAVCLLSSTVLAQAREPDSIGPPAEIRTGDPAPALPAVPTFSLTTSTVHSVRELRVRGTALFDTEVTVTGVVTWAYDCVAALRKAKESAAAAQHRIDEDPTLCERPKFYLGDTMKTPREKSLWVVDVPRVYNKLELERIQKANRDSPDRCEPGDTKQHRCPPYKVGDLVTVTGQFKLASPHSERNSDGLLVFERMCNATRKWATDGSTWPAGSPPTPVSPAARPIAKLPALPTAPPTRSVHANRAEIETRVAAAQNAFANQAYTDAIAEAQKAIAMAPDEHMAFYMLGGAYAFTGDWARATSAFESAAKLRPEVAMYEMWSGVAQYELAVATERDKVSRAQGVKPEQAQIDLTTVSFDHARIPLLLAVQIEPKLWRAQLYLGRIDRAAHADQAAAEDFSRAIAANPREGAPYVALTELYRRWDFTDEAIAVATIGTANVAKPTYASDVWFELGSANDEKGELQKAIDAFSKAIETNPDNLNALFQRGRDYAALKHRAEAKRDLESFVAKAPPSLAHETAEHLLFDL